MRKWLKIAHHSHTGRLRPHEDTSFLMLGILLVVTGLVMAMATVSAATPYTGPEGGSVGLHGIMPAPPPSVAPQITYPTNGSRFPTTPINVRGTCEKGTLVEIFKSDIFAGSAICGEDGKFATEIDLLIGENILIARSFDDLNQSSPTSNPVTVYYDALPFQADPLAPLNFGGAQMILITDPIFRGLWPGKEFNVPLTIIGGSAPFAIKAEWGDGSNKVIPRPDNQTFNMAHTYKKAGTYQMRFQATDSAGRVAFLTVVGIVNGDPTGANNPAGGTVKRSLLWLWPLFAAAAAIVLAFWLGERREKHILQKRHLLLTPQ